LGERESDDEPADPADEGRAFHERPVSSRIVVSLAGPLFNFLFAFLAYWVLFINGIPTMKPAVGIVTPASVAADAGLEFGDRILKVGETEVVDWEMTLVTLLDEVLSDGKVALELEGVDGWIRSATLDVGDNAGRLTEPGQLFAGLGFEPWQPPAVIETVGPEGAAQAGGIIVQDRITAIAGESVKNFRDLQRIVAARPDEQVTIELVRDGGPQTLQLTIGSRELQGVTSGFLDVGIGAAAQDYWYVRKHSPFAAIGESVQKTWVSSAFTVRMLGRMVTGEVSIKNISGPINIAQYAGNAAVAGLNEFLSLLAMISISLGVLNLLPIPVLDGGQIVYHIIEGLKGSPLSQHAQLIGQQVGVVALLMLMSFAFYNDIARILG
jgi:regulator of sigma E protease